MEAQEMIALIHDAKKRTPVKLYYQSKQPIAFANCRVFGNVVFGEWEDIQAALEQHREDVIDYVVEASCHNSALPLLDIKGIPARIEPGALIRDQVVIKENAVIMMGAIINVGACIEAETMIDMGAVIGARARIGRGCHIGAGAVIAGVVEPLGAKPVVIEDEVLVGANAVVIEGVHIGKGAVIAAGAIVTADVPKDAVAAGVPARIVKYKDAKTKKKTRFAKELRSLQTANEGDESV